MSSGRTSWWAKDGGWYDRERVVELGEEFGPAGPLVLDWLSCQAKLQNDGPFDAPTGVVKSGFRAVARGCFIADVDIVRAIVELAVEIGALDDLQVDGRTFTCRISGWKSEQGRAAQTSRKRDQRATGQPGTDGDNSGRKAPRTSQDIPGQPGTTRDEAPVVPECLTTGPDRTLLEEEEQGRDRSSEHTQHSALPAVLDVLHAVPDLTVDPLPVLSTLAANAWATDDELVAAAHHVAAWARSPTDPPRVRDAGTLLRGVLQRAARDRISPPRTTGRHHLRPVDAQEADDAARLERLAANVHTTTEGAA